MKPNKLTKLTTNLDPCASGHISRNVNARQTTRTKRRGGQSPCRHTQQALRLARSHQPMHDTQLLVALCLQARHLAPQPREVCAGGPASALRCTQLLAAATTAAAAAAAAAAATASAAAAAAVQRGEGLTAHKGARYLAVQRVRSAAQRVQHRGRAEAEAKARTVG